VQCDAVDLVDLFRGEPAVLGALVLGGTSCARLEAVAGVNHVRGVLPAAVIIDDGMVPRDRGQGPGLLFHLAPGPGVGALVLVQRAAVDAPGIAVVDPGSAFFEQVPVLAVLGIVVADQEPGRPVGAEMPVALIAGDTAIAFVWCLRRPGSRQVASGRTGFRAAREQRRDHVPEVIRILGVSNVALGHGMTRRPVFPAGDRRVRGAAADLADHSGESLQRVRTDRPQPVLAGKTGSPRALRGRCQVPRRRDQGREPVPHPVHASQVSAVAHETAQALIHPAGRFPHPRCQDTHLIGRPLILKRRHQTIETALQFFAAGQDFIARPDDPAYGTRTPALFSVRPDRVSPDLPGQKGIPALLQNVHQPKKLTLR